MIKFLGGLRAMVLICATALVPISATAAASADKAPLQQATAACRAQIKEYAHYHEMSWYSRSKAIKACIKDALAKK